MWDLWWTKWQWFGFFSEFFGCPPLLCQYYTTIVHRHINTTVLTITREAKSGKLPTKYFIFRNLGEPNGTVLANLYISLTVHHAIN
jgi:hypothetical protein